ncbi:centrosomal protein dilatory [Calliopsis andreniformis]|uniref:centrosomal protein dilatory n=1 Tax=Calliopsis andreniformis TaxID=337506 RepID=UPI003FCE24B2
MKGSETLLTTTSKVQLSNMINISHPKIQSKPPIKKSFPAKNIKPKLIEMTQERIAGDKENIPENLGVIAEKADYNQNIIETTTNSFEQLCSMINDLERNITGEVTEIDHLQLEPEKDDSKEKHAANGETTYDNIMSFLAKLEEGTLDESMVNVPEVDHAMLQKAFKNSQVLPCIDYDSIVTEVENHLPPTFKEDLATARLQLEEKNATITLLKEQLRSERKSACEKLDAQRKSSSSKLQAQDDKYKGIVKRHQKFIEQLISEKTELTEKCNSLVQKVKDIETKMQRDMKAAADRHLVELQRAKEHYAAAEKIKRERWIEARTTKIKEMTVKGLETELRNMMEQHSEEIQGLRNAHMKELQDTELRAIRRSNQQLEQLRLELTASHDRMLSNEKNILWTRYKEKLEEQENQFNMQQIKLLDEMQRDRKKFEEERAKRDAEKESALQQMHQQYQQDIETLKQQHSADKKSLQESLRIEWEAWLADYKKQQNLRIEQLETNIRDKCNKERDRQIELAIERIEQDSRNEKLTLQQNFDCKLRSLKDKFETDLQTAIDNEQFHKGKLTQVKEKLDGTETQLRKVESKLQECAFELNNANEVIKRLSAEKDNAKKLARQEIEAEKRELEEKIASLYQEITQNNANRDISTAQLYSRIKLVMTQKVLTIKNLTKELNDAKSKCEHLEKLLDQQRREYILKSL